MTILARAFISSACYHVTTRGNQKQTVFREEDDYNKYLGMLRRATKKYDISLYAYCLMHNHVHLLTEPKCSRDISKFMMWINRGYASYFNTKYNTVGHVWQGRFRSKPIMKDEYLINCATYIEANPVKSGIVDNIAEYKWSSYCERCLGFKREVINEMLIEA